MPIDSGNLALKGLDDLFSTEENRQEEQREQVQQIPMQRMFEDGTCRVRPGYYTRTIQYQDINYQLAQQEDKTAIFEEWCSFLNFFDSSITYTQNGDYLIPNIIIRKTKPLGHYGRLRKAYLEMHRPILFNELVLSDKLFEHCAEIDEAARNRMELIVRSLAEQNGVTEQLKAENQMEWVRQMNACKAQAEEVVKAELIYD